MWTLLQPENLLYASPDDDSELKIADFGMATWVEGSAPTEYMCGTPGYLAPEVIKGQPYTSKIDVWALGVVTYIL